MGVQLHKPSLDLGIVTEDASRALAFYRDTLGLEPLGEVTFPNVGVVNRLACGDSVIRILALEKPAKHHGSREGMTSATGYRYCTLTVTNLDEVVSTCRERGYKIAVEIRDLRPGVRVATVEDPDGNTVEFMGVAADS